jgi:hypothetical protein
MPSSASLAGSRDLLRAGIQRLDYRLTCLDDQLYGPSGQVDDDLTIDEINALLDAQLAVMDTAVGWMLERHKELVGDSFAHRDELEAA